jgi:O-antigen/teichoic acid export membrane protein
MVRMQPRGPALDALRTCNAPLLQCESVARQVCEVVAALPSADNLPAGGASAVVPGRLSLRRNFAWTFAGNAIYAACQWAVLVVIAKMTSPAELGQFALSLAITAPILIFANQGLRDLQATDARRHFQFRDYLRYRLLSVLVALALILALTRIFDYPVIVMIVGLSKAVESIIDLVYGQYQQHERMDWMATSFMLRGVLSVLGLGVLLYTTRSIAWGASGLVFANAGVLALYDLRRRSLFSETAVAVNDRSPSSGSTAFRLMMLGLPLGLAHMLNSFSIAVPRYYLARYAGETSLGIFAAISYLLVAGRTVIAAAAQSCVARLARLYADGELRAFRSLLFRQILLAVAFGAAGIVFSIFWGAPFLRVIYRPEYAEYTGILLLAMVTSALNHVAEFTGTGLTAVRSIRVQPLILGSCVLVGWVSSAFLIPRYGIVGAAWSVLLIGACQLLLCVCVLTYVVYRNHMHAGSVPRV